MPDFAALYRLDGLVWQEAYSIHFGIIILNSCPKIVGLNLFFPDTFS